MKILTGLNFDSKLSIDDLTFLFDNLEAEILERFKIGFGHMAFPYPLSGIIDSFDARSVSSVDTNRPLLVYQSGSNQLRINVTPGLAVSANGALLRVPVLIEDFVLSRTDENDVLVAFLENELVDSPPVRITRYNISQYTRKIQNTSVLKSDLLSNFNSSVLYPPQRKDNIVVLSVIKIVNSSSGLTTQMDYTNSLYQWNRPWFSMVDIEHRSFLGSGEATSKNPHGLTFSDLVSGSMTIYDQFLKCGLIQSRDEQVKGVPGIKCSEVISTGRVLIDTSGSITAKSRFGGINAKYITLSKFPIGIIAFYWQSHKGRSLSCDHITGTRIVVLPTPETVDQTSVIEYTSVSAAEPPATILSNNLMFGTPVTGQDLIISQGLAVSSMSNPYVNMDGSGPIPREFIIYVKGDGNLLKVPEVVTTPLLLDNLGTTSVSVDYSFFGPTKVSVGLAEANPVVTMEVIIRLTGKDVNGTSISEDLTFSGGTWAHVPLPGNENPNQKLTSTSIFVNLSNIQVISRTDDGPSSKIMLYGELDTVNTLAINKLAKSAKVSWDGLSANNMRDARDIKTTLTEKTNSYGYAYLRDAGVTKKMVAVEDFANPKYRYAALGSSAATNAIFDIIVNDYSLISNGDTITLPNGKVITAIVSGAPNRAVGQFLAAISDTATRDDIVLTLSNPTFASGVTPTPDAVNNKKLLCVLSIIGARGNGDIVKALANPSSISISGDPLPAATGGIDAYSENYTNKQQDYIETDIPSASLYEVSNIQGRYVSIPIPINNKNNIEVIIFGLEPGYDGVQLRARVANDLESSWLPWEVINSTSALFLISKTRPITKVQLEMFGKCSGFAVYEA